MDDNFIPYEEAYALKMLGFNTPCFGHYKPIHNPDKTLVTYNINEIQTKEGYAVSAILYQQAFPFLLNYLDDKCAGEDVYSICLYGDGSGHIIRNVIKIKECRSNKHMLKKLIKLCKK